MSCVTPTTQCKGETCWSSILMSALPPVLPMLVLALVSWRVRPFEGSAMTEIVIVVLSGSERPDFLFMTKSGQAIMAYRLLFHDGASCPQAVTTSWGLDQNVLLRKDRSYGTKGWKRQDESTCSEYQRTGCAKGCDQQQSGNRIRAISRQSDYRVVGKSETVPTSCGSFSESSAHSAVWLGN